MEQIFLKVLNISISASILIIVVIAARLLLKKAPKWCVMLLWAIVALRLVIPVSIESAFSLIPRGMDEKIESIEAAVIDRNTDQEQIPQAEANNMPVTVTGDIQEDVTYIPYEIVEITEPVKPELSIFEIAGYIWIAGVGLMLMFSLFSYIKLKLRMLEAVKYKDNIYLSDRTATAFILGMIRPRIYLPLDIDEGEIAYVIAHEHSHIKRGDHLWKPLAYLLLCVYWFNPLMWLAYSLLSRDIEYACDERTVSGYDMKDRKAYAAALLENSIQKKLVMVCPLAFGEGSIKERVRKVLDHKKPAFWICIVSLAVVAIVGICFATKPKNDGDTAATEEGGVATEDGALAASQDTEENKVGTKKWYWPSVSPIEGILRFGTKMNGSILDHVEISGRERAPVFAACEGSIAEKGYDDEWGNYIVEDIGNGILLKYGQLGSDYTYTGDIVKPGQIIGLVKKAKGCTVARLYYAAYENGVAIDPLSLTDNWTFDQSEEIMKRFIDTVDADPVTTDVSVYEYMLYGQDGGQIYTHMYIDREEDATEEHLSAVSERLNEDLQKVLDGEFENEIDKDCYKVSFNPLRWYDRVKQENDTGSNKEADNNIEVVVGQQDTEYKLNTEYLPAQTIAADSKLMQPPTVTITYAGRAYVATQGTYHWSYVNADNEAVEISADTAHPLDMVERLTHVYKVNSVNDIVFNFSLTPVKMDMRYWKLECAGDPDSYEKSAKSHFIYNADPVDGPSSLIFDIPEDAPIVVELSGEWKNGTSSYCFVIMPEEPAGEAVTDWMDIRLPEGFILSQYSDYNGHMGGYNILPQAYTVDTHVNSVNWSWLTSGVITRLPASNVQLVFTDKHAPYFGADSHFYMDNHTDQEYIKTITLERRPDGWYALEFSEDHDLYTYAQLYELEQQGVEIEEDKRISSYYVFWYVKEDAGTYYMISLAKNKFTQEQAEKIATSVTILE